MNTQRLRNCAAAFLAVASALTALAYYAGDVLPESLLPLFRSELEWLMPGFRIDYLDLQEQKGETVVLMQATLHEYRIVLGRMIPPGVSISASTLAMHAWAHPILMFGLLAAWPGIPPAQKPALLLAGVPWLLLAELMDIPLVLWGAVEDMLYWQADPTMADPPMGSIVQHALDGGGRYGMTMLFSLFAIFTHRSATAAMGAWLAARRTPAAGIEAMPQQRAAES